MESNEHQFVNHLVSQPDGIALVCLILLRQYARIIVFATPVHNPDPSLPLITSLPGRRTKYCTYFRFCWWRHVFTQWEGMGRNRIRRICFVEFVRWRHVPGA